MTISHPLFASERYTSPHYSLLVIMLIVGVAAMARRPAGAMGAPVPAEVATAPTLRVEAKPRQAFPPLHLVTETHQQPALVAGREVCIHVQGPEEFMSCWQDDNPVVIVNRTFELHSAGDYEVFASTGDFRSNMVRITAVSE